ncbi:MAG: phosphonate ABC transporter ATP-binding protein [Treponema sp.]
MLEISNLTKRYNNGFLALDNVSFSVKEGEFVAVVGQSGAGKSTLLRCINNLEEHSGNVVVNGLCIEKLSQGALRKVRKDIAFIFQNYNLVENLSVLENVLHGILGKIGFFRSVFGIYKQEEKEEACLLIEALGLLNMRYRCCVDLSGGQKQRVGIARALMQSPSIILADEPTSSLDVNSTNIVLNLLKKKCKEKGITSVVNLHQIEGAKKFADRIIALKKGKIVFDASPQFLTDDEIKKIFESC